MSLKPLEVTTSKIATKAVTADKIADNAIENRSIKTGTITPDKLTIIPVGRPLSPGLETSEIKDSAITSNKIAPNAVTTDHIAANAVATDDIKDNAITTAKIRDGAITREKVADQSVRTEDIVDGAVTGPKIASSAVGSSKLAVDSVETTKIKDGAVTNSKIATNAITTGKIATGAVGTSDIANGAVTAEKLAPGVGGGSRITWLPTRIQLTSLMVTGNQPWMPSAPNPSIPAEATALLVQVELINNLDNQVGFINCRIRRDATQQGCLSLGIESNYQGKVSGCMAIVPVTAGSFEYSFTEASGSVSVTFNPYIIGYIV